MRGIFKKHFFAFRERTEISLGKGDVKRNFCKFRPSERGYLRADGKKHTLDLMKFSFGYCDESACAVIGKGGETIQKIQKETGTTITITEDTERHKGIVDIFSADRDALDKALAWIEGICAVPEVGAVYHGKVVSILDFGAFVEILPGKEGLLHVSEIAWEKTENVADVLKVGDEVDVKLLEIDEKSGKMRLSMRALQDKPEGYVEPERRPRGPRDDRKGDRRPNDRRAPRDDRRAPRDDRRGERRDDRKAPRRPFGQKNEEAAEKAPDFETGSDDILF